MSAATVIVPSQSPAGGRLDRLLASLAVQTIEHETIVIDNDSPGRAVTATCSAYDFAEVVLAADGAELRWPTDRGELFAEHEQAYGTAVADRWRRLVDQLDDVWQTVRKLGWEAELTGKAELTGPVRRRIEQDRTVADLAREIDHPHLAARGTFVAPGGVTQPAPAPRFSRTPASLGAPPPRPGEHTREALAAWGVRDVDALIAGGAAVQA